LGDRVLLPLAHTVIDQFSLYVRLLPFAQLRLHELTWRQRDRTYLFLRIADRGGPLRMRDVMRKWQPEVEHEWLPDFVEAIACRRWYFVGKSFYSFVLPVLQCVAEGVVAHYLRHPGVPVQVGTMRIVEDVDRTRLSVELLHGEEDENLSGKI